MQSDSSDDDDDDDVDLLSVAEDLCLASALLTSRNNKITRSRIRWQQTKKVYRVPAQMQQPHEPTILGYVPSDAPNVVSRECTSILRDVLSAHIHKLNLK
jgi:hypothetical protein